MIRAAILAMLALTPLCAQLDRGSVTGAVSDSSGAMIPGVRITVRNLATNAVYPGASNMVGQFTVPNLPAGDYQVVFEAEGFKKLVRDRISLGLTQVVRIDGKLEVGAVAESVEVTAEVSTLQTESPEVGTSLTGNQIIDMPLTFSGARSAEDFAYKLAPGVSGDGYDSHIAGSASFSKEVLLDGASVTVFRSGDFGQMSTSVESLQEFRVQTSGMSAEYGRTQAGVFNFGMKSGANKVHGSAYGGLRNEAFNANTFVNNYRGQPRAQERKQNYAFSFGGPAYLPKIYNGKDKTFFYVTYERFRQRIGGFRAPDRVLPVPEFYDGDFSRLLGAVVPNTTDALGRQVIRGAVYDPTTFRLGPDGRRYVGEMFPGNRIPVSRFSQVSQRLNAIAKEHYLPTVKNAQGISPLTVNSTFPVSSTPKFDQHQFSVKMDQNISSHQKLSGSYSYNFRPRRLLDQGGMWDITDPDGGVLSKARDQPLRSHLVRLAHDYTLSPSVLNHLGIYANRLGNTNNSVHADIDGGALLGIKNFSTVGVPVINWGGGPSVTLQNPGDPQVSFLASTAWGVQDTLSWSKGRHFIKAGFDVRGNMLNSRSGPGGTFNFAATATSIPNEAFSGSQTGYSFATYLLGIVTSGSLSDPVGLGGRRRYYATFVQDDFKINRSLTLNIGMRWEAQPPTTEVADRMSNFNFTKIDPVSGLPGATEFAGFCKECAGTRIFGKNDWNNFGPRVGLAWRPGARLVVRASYGVMYEGDTFNGLYGVVPGGSGGATSGTYSLGADPLGAWRGIFNWDNGMPTNRYTPPVKDPSFANRNQTYGTSPDYGISPYVQSWNFNLQRQLPLRLVVDAGYLGRKGTSLRAGVLDRVNQMPAWALEKYGRSLGNIIRTPADAAQYGISLPYPGFAGTLGAALRPFPQVFGNTHVGEFGSPVGFSTYHALQIIVNRQTSKGVSAYANYTWSKTLTNVESSDPIGISTRPLDTYNRKLEKAIAPYDNAHMFKGTVSYQLPVGRGKALLGTAPRVVSAVLGGWSISAICNYFGGLPVALAGANSPFPNVWNGAVNRANVAAGELRAPNFDKSSFSLANTNSPSNTYLVKSQFSDPTPLTLGSGAYRYTQIRNFGTINEDIGIWKNFRIREGVRWQLRAEFLNAFNRHNIGGVTANVTSPGFGQVTTVTGNRNIQFGSRIDF